MNKIRFNEIEDVVPRDKPGIYEIHTIAGALSKSEFRETCENACFNIALPVKVAYA
jgi:hypothetical protein